MNSYGLLWSYLSSWISYAFLNSDSYGLQWAPLNSCSHFQLLTWACLYSSLNLDSYELLWTPLVFSLELDQLLFLKLRLLWTPMDSAELLQPLPASDLSLSLLILELWLLWTPMDSSGLYFQAGSVTLSKTQTHMDFKWLSWTLTATSSFWLELVSTHPWTLTHMNSYGLLRSFLLSWISCSF